MQKDHVVMMMMSDNDDGDAQLHYWLHTSLLHMAYTRSYGAWLGRTSRITLWYAEASFKPWLRRVWPFPPSTCPLPCVVDVFGCLYCEPNASTRSAGDQVAAASGVLSLKSLAAADGLGERSA